MIVITGVRTIQPNTATTRTEVKVDGFWYVIHERNRQAIGVIESDMRMIETIVNQQRCIRCKMPLNNIAPGFSIVASRFFVCTNCLQTGEEILRAKGLTG